MRRSEPWMDHRQPGPEQAIPGHRIEDADLPKKHHDEHARDPRDRACRHQRAAPSDAHCVQGLRNRRLDVNLCVGNHPGQDGRHNHVQNGTNTQRGHEPDRDVPLRIAGFLSRCGDRIETDVGKENDGRGRAHPRKAVRHERRPIGGIDGKRSDGNEEQHHGDLNRDDDAGHAGAFFDADDQQDRQREHNQSSRQIDDAALEWRIDERHRQVNAHSLENTDQIAGPPNRDRDAGHAVFQYEVPAGDPCEEFPETRIRVGVCGAGYRDHGGELGIAQRGQHTRDA